MKKYTAPRLMELGDITTLTGFSGSDTQQDTIIFPNGEGFGTINLPGPSSEFACEIDGPVPDECAD